MPVNGRQKYSLRGDILMKEKLTVTIAVSRLKWRGYKNEL